MDNLEAKDLRPPEKAATYTPPGPNPLGGTMNDVPAGAKDWFQPDPGARRDYISAPPVADQPGENVGGGDGSMVTTSPSASGTGSMAPGTGQRASGT
jgi:hypothetical protein